MAGLDLYSEQTPFDAIRREDECGEYWTARDLERPLGYERWERFQDAIERAISAINNTGSAAPDHIRASAKLVQTGHGERQIIDYRLTRFGAYMIAMNGDPRKPEIAAAQTYFAVKTREAETTRPVAALTEDQIVQQALQITARRVEQLETRVAELEPKADLADAYLTADGGDRLVGQVAKLLGLKEKDLRRFLIEDHLVFVRHSKCGAVQYEPYAEFSRHFSVREKVVDHTWGNCSHFTIRVRPAGIDLIRRRLGRAGLIALPGGAA